jgi:HK97 family phage portal protein
MSRGRRKKRAGGVGVKPAAVRSLENPNTPLTLDDPDGFREAFGQSKSASGVRVTMRRALGYPAVWRGVRIVSGDVAKLSLLPYRKDGKNREVDTKHPVYWMLAHQPNPYCTPFVLKQTLQMHALLRGNGYAYIDREGGKPTRLLILDPLKVEPIRAKGEMWYVYAPDGVWDDLDGLRLIPAADILHIRGLGYDGLKGYDVVSLLSDSFGAAIAARDHSARYFANSARPGGLIKHPGKLSDPARKNIRESWERIHKGLDNSHKVAILEEGAEFVGFVSNARDAQLLETRQFDAIEVANILGVPSHKLGDNSKVAYNSLGEENQSYHDDTLSHWLQLWAEEGSAKLLTEQERRSESHCIGWDYNDLSRANPAELREYAKAAGAGAAWADENEIRGLFGLNARTKPAPENGAVADPTGGEGATGGGDAATKAAGAGDVQATALNGAQIASLVAVVDKLVADQYPADGAEAMIQAAFPVMDRALISQFISAIGSHTPPEPEPEPAPVPAPAAPDVSEGVRAILIDAARRMVRRFVSHAHRGAGRADFGEWVGTLPGEHTRIAAEAFGPALVLCRSVGLAGDWTADALAADLFGSCVEAFRRGGVAAADELADTMPADFARLLIGG